MKHVYLACGVGLTAILLWAGVSRSASEVFSSGPPHWLPHFVSFAALGFAWVGGLPRAPVLGVLLGVVVFGFGHEAIEIIGHAHAYELADALVDGAGAAFGSLLAYLVVNRGKPRQAE